jgi:proteasome accessory factor C
MSDHAKFQRMLEILLMLDCKFGRSIDEISRRYNISQRTVYRYFDTFSKAGFVINNNKRFYNINHKNSLVDNISHLLHFSEEESLILSKAIHSIEDDNELRTKLVHKLCSLYDFDRVIHAIVKKEDTPKIYNLLQAIKHQKQVILKDYKSGHGGTIRDRLVEPLDFTNNYNAVWCFDTEDKKNKIFKSSRITRVLIQEENWRFVKKHKVGNTDIFRIHDYTSFPVKIRLSLMAFNLLIEEFPLAEPFLKKENDNEYILETKVCNYLGVGRFVLGLPKEVEVLGDEKFKNYLKNQI